MTAETEEAVARVEALAGRSPGAFSRLIARCSPDELRRDLRTTLTALERAERERDRISELAGHDAYTAEAALAAPTPARALLAALLRAEMEKVT